VFCFHAVIKPQAARGPLIDKFKGGIVEINALYPPDQSVSFLRSAAVKLLCVFALNSW